MHTCVLLAMPPDLRGLTWCVAQSASFRAVQDSKGRRCRVCMGMNDRIGLKRCREPHFEDGSDSIVTAV